MTRNSIFLKTTSILGLVVAMAQPAMAMTCAEYNDMDEAAQMDAVTSMGGREKLREHARGADEGEQTQTTSATKEIGDPGDDNGGRAAARAAATGSDEELMVVFKEECENNPDMMFDDMFEQPQTK